MKNTTTPFWVEGMSLEERSHKILNLFEVLEKKLALAYKNKKKSAVRTFVFVPDPPPLKLKERTQHYDIHYLSWGVAGQAIATETIEEAVALAPIIFDLWPESLYLFAFREKTEENATLEKWVNNALQIKFDAESNDKISRSKMPSYAIVMFDWGDLVSQTSDG